MSNAQHTPGPWVYSTSPEGWSYTIHIYQSDNAPYTPEWSDVAFSTCKGENQQIQEANARLIAAAPELLEVAMIVASLNKNHCEIGAGMLANMVDKANAAIKKATGQ